ncbi:MAG: GAF domain-containing protein [Armatimonadota bacterium]|nr:GAF domain-containing protein [bacterium]MCS7309690.1 GAF domain-containing protein [Armatimonadota bacterium]MDW8104717.1 GAF domain-containing protein [Armatimonadota bacterium]MDW8290269.1 GAF domain-containing protein [Armatimonadota bacterium]
MDTESAVSLEQQATSLHRVAQLAVDPIPVEEALRRIAEEACLLTDASASAVAFLTESETKLRLAAVAGESVQDLRGTVFRVENSLMESAVRRGENAIPYYPLRPDPVMESLLGGERLRGAAVVPIQCDQRIWGALAVLNRRDGSRFDSSDVRLLQILASHIASLWRRRQLEQRNDRLRRELDVMYHAARSIGSSLNLNQVLEAVLDEVAAHLPHAFATLFLLTDERTHLFIAAEHGLQGEEREVMLAADEGLQAEVLRTGEPRLVNAADVEPGVEQFVPRLRILSALYAPVRSRTRTLGLLLVTSTSRNAYTEADLKLLNGVASLAGIAIENAMLYEDAHRRAEEATSIYELSQLVNSSLELNSVLNLVADSVLRLLQVDKFALMLYDSNEGVLRTKVSRGVDPVYFDRLRPARGQGIPGWVFEFQSPVYVLDVAADSRNAAAPLDKEGVVSVACVPLQVGMESMGVMLAMSSRRRLFTIAEMELLYTIANQAAVAIDNALRYEEERKKSEDLRQYFLRVARAIGSTVQQGEVPQLIANIAAEVLRADRAVYYAVEGGRIRMMAVSGMRIVPPLDEEETSSMAWVVKTGRPLLAYEASSDVRFRDDPFVQREGMASCLAVPIGGKQPTSLLAVYTLQPRKFSSHDAELLSTVAELVLET